MARSPLMLAASVTAAVPEAEVVSVSTLTSGGEGRHDAAVATLADGRDVLVRVPRDQETDAELATEVLALQALSDGVRALLSFAAPEFLGTARLGDSRAFLTSFLPGYQVDAEHMPAGRGVAASVGAAIAQVHALPASVVRSAGLAERNLETIRDDVRRLVEEAGATGRVPVRLMLRWRDAIDDDAMWRFEPCVTLGGIGADSFVFDERDAAPAVVGVIRWHGLQVTDPAVDLQLLLSATEAAAAIFGAYSDASQHKPDEAILARARLHSELEFAKWLLHGRDQRSTEIMDDAAHLLDSLAEDIRDHDLRSMPAAADIDEAMAALRSVPATAAATIDTSMQTDTYDPEDIAVLASTSADTQAIDDTLFAADDEAAHRNASAQSETAAIDTGVFASESAAGDSADLEEAREAAQNAIRRWAQD